MKWKLFSKGKLFFQHKLGFNVIKPVSDESFTPLFCPNCKQTILSTQDKISYKQNKCCEFCTIKWVDLNRDEWENGWRPTKDEVNSVLETRNKRKKEILIR